jgi:hypothetical protein
VNVYKTPNHYATSPIKPTLYTTMCIKPTLYTMLMHLMDTHRHDLILQPCTETLANLSANRKNRRYVVVLSFCIVIFLSYCTVVLSHNYLINLSLLLYNYTIILLFYYSIIFFVFRSAQILLVSYPIILSY